MLILAVRMACTPKVPVETEPSDASVEAGTLAVVGATVWDGTGAPAVADATVLIDRDTQRIAAVGTDVVVPDGAQVLDARGRYVVPGLIDSHVHFFQSSGLYTRPDIVDLRAVRSYAEEAEGVRAHVGDTLIRYLASGITGVVDMGGPMWNFEVRDPARGVGPRVAAAGPLIATVSRPQLVHADDPPILEATTPDEARALVRAQLPADPDLIKLWYILPDSGDPAENLPVMQAAMDEAHAHGKRVAVHATQLETARMAVRAGADILAHSIDDAPVDEAFVQLLLDEGVPLIPTLVVYEGYGEVLGQQVDLSSVEWRLGSPRAQRSWGELAVVDDPTPPERHADRLAHLAAARPVMSANLRTLHEAGVVIAAGTDAGNIGTLHGPSLHRELELMAEAGLSNEAILLAATRGAATVFADEPELGTLEVGKLGDLLLLDADPLEDLAALQRPSTVVLGGRALDPRALVDPHPAWIVQEQVHAYNARDLDAFAALYAEDVEVLRWGGEEVLRGRDALREVYGPLFAASPELRCRILEREVSGRYVVDHELVTGLRGGPAVRAVAIYEVCGAVIRRVTFLPKEE